MGNLLSKHKGYSQDNPIYKLGLQVGSRSLASSSPNTQGSGVAQDDPMQPAIDQIEQALRAKVLQVMAEEQAQKASK
jgi:hypothetical protein